MTESTPRQSELLEELAALQAQNRARALRLARMLRAGSLLVAASFVFLLRGDLRYWTRPAAPVDLGGPLQFDLDREGSQRHVKLVGVPGRTAANVSHLSRNLRLFGILGTNVLVVQDADRVPRDQMPAADTPYATSGRLVREDEAGELSGIFRMMERAGIVARTDGHLYALYEGEAPRQGWGLPLELLGILGFVTGKPDDVAMRVRAYHDGIKQAKPLGRTVNNQCAVLIQTYCAPTREEAIADVTKPLETVAKLSAQLYLPWAEKPAEQVAESYRYLTQRPSGDTRAGARPATLPDTMLTMAAICSFDRLRPGLTATTTEADDLSPSLATNDDDLAMARCTRAEAMASRVRIDCASSPSRPRRKRTSCTNCDTPSGSFLSISSRPAGSCAVTPLAASSMRTLPSWPVGTITWPESGWMRYGTCSASSTLIMSLAATFSCAPNTGL